MENFDYSGIKELINNSDRIVITSHHNPDGDAIGSVLALTALLKKVGKDAVAMVPNEFPAFLQWMPGAGEIAIYKQSKRTSDELLSKADVIFCLDYNALHRTGDLAKPIHSSKAKRILIDHHIDPSLEEFDFHYSVIAVSSTAELVYRFIEGCGWLDRIDDVVATGLFVGIMTDTGSFSYACNYPETFNITASLLGTGINAESIHRLVYDTYSESRLRLLGYCLSEKLIILPEFSTAYIALSMPELDRFNYQVGDTEGIVNYALSIDNIKVAVFLTERKDRVRISFRSKGDFAVNRIASEHFSGGGHRNAAGGDSFVNLDDTVARLKEVLGQYKDAIDRSSSF